MRSTLERKSSKAVGGAAPRVQHHGRRTHLAVNIRASRFGGSAIVQHMYYYADFHRQRFRVGLQKNQKNQKVERVGTDLNGINGITDITGSADGR
jgi:hypothetical protein